MEKQPAWNLVTMPRVWTLVVISVFFGMISCDDWFDEDEGTVFKGYIVADHLDTPWELDVAPDGRLFFTQRPGIIDVVENGNVKVWLRLDSVVQEIGESGLLGLALHPDFDQNGYVYFAYTYAESKSPLVLINKIVRYKENPATKA
ncbi:MAG TPA: PQQ-dependent sugar dehydrogenase, partial [Chryseolinea sp.]|nr:PQQ-dependent sugar dehydrogenase [Chryseolinea sp.]